jgi:hypothetical protein
MENSNLWSADASRRREAALLIKSGVALYLPPHSKVLRANALHIQKIPEKFFTVLGQD